MDYYQEQGALLPRENVTHYEEEVWVITKKKCGLLPRESGLLPRENVTHYQEKVCYYQEKM